MLSSSNNSVQSFSHVQFFVIPWTAARQASLSITNSWNSLRLMSIESVMPSSHLILCSPFLLHLQSFPALGSLQIESVLCIMWPKYWSFSFRISPSNEYSGLISFRIDWFDLFAVQGTPATQFEIISSSAFNLLYGPALISVHDYWNNHSFD